MKWIIGAVLLLLAFQFVWAMAKDKPPPGPHTRDNTDDGHDKFQP